MSIMLHLQEVIFLTENYNYPDQVENAYNAMRDRIFALLKDRHISQRKFATQLGIEPQTITDWKKGRSRSFAGMIGAIADTLQTSFSWLIEGTGAQFETRAERKEAAERFHEQMRAEFEAAELERKMRFEKQMAAAGISDGLDLELWELLKRIPPERMPEVERYLRFQADSEEKP